MTNTNINPYQGTTPLEKKRRFWFNVLWKRFISCFKFEGLPDTINEYYLKAVLFSRGYIIGLEFDGKPYTLFGGIEGLDPYLYPLRGVVANPVLGTKNVVFGVNGVYGIANQERKSVVPLISEYAEQLADIDVNIYVNLKNTRTSKIFKADSPQQAKKISQYLNDINNGNIAVLENSTAGLISGGNDFDTAEVNYLCNSLLKDRRSILNDFLTEIGCNNCAFEKNERLLNDEINANNQEILVNRLYFLEPITEFCNNMNKMFGLNMSVKFVDEIENEDKGAISNDDNGNI